MDLFDLEDLALPINERQKFFNRTAGTHFGFQAAAADKPAEIDIYDEIGFWGVTAKDFRQQLVASTGDLVVKINSPGGNVFDGLAMFNDLKAYNKGRVRVEVTGMAASAASIVALAGHELAVAENGFLMIHNAWTIAFGNRHDMEESAKVLGKIDGALARTYANKSGLGMRTIAKMMDDETWMTGAEAKEKGFADSVMSTKREDDPVSAKARFDMSAFMHVPQALAWQPDASGAPETIRDIERELMRDAGQRTRSQARSLIRALRSPDAPKPGAGGEGLEALLNTLKQTSDILQPNVQ